MSDESELPELTQAELYDLVVVQTAKNEFEAIAIIDALEDAGIPVMKQGGAIQLGLFVQTGVSVPRKLFEQAKAVLAKSQAEARERGVDEAFKYPSIRDQWEDTKRDQLTTEMLWLSRQKGPERDSRLSQYVLHWLTEGESAPDMASHLAAAGLNRDEAEKLVEITRFEYLEGMREKLHSRLITGLALILVGVLTSMASLAFSDVIHNFRIFVQLGVTSALCGGFMALIAAHRMSKLKKN